MAGSLKDQLIKAGLVTPDRAKKVERQARVEQQARRKAKKGAVKGAAPEAEAPAPLSEAEQRARQLQREKAERDRALSRAVADKAAAKARLVEIRQIILANDQRAKTTSDDDVAYNFVHGKRVKRIYLPPAQREQIVSGSLVIVNNDGIYHLLPRKAAEKVRARDAKRIIVDTRETDDKPPDGSDDEYYAQFKVPDDLDW